jgi:hypothetical protein
MNIRTITSAARRSRLTIACLVATMAALGVAGCGAHYYSSGGDVDFGVGTAYGPYWYPATYGSFTVVRYPWWGDPPPPPEHDPMTAGTGTARAIHDQAIEDFSARGYRHEEGGGDVDVAVYASNRPGELDINGYVHNYDWKNIPKLKNKTKYPRGTVVVDVLAPRTHELLWRGTTAAHVDSDPDKYADDLRQAVNRIVQKYPKSEHK